MLDISNLKDLPKELRISTMTATSKFNSNINLKSLYDAIKLMIAFIMLNLPTIPLKVNLEKRYQKKKGKKKGIFQSINNIDLLKILLIISNFLIMVRFQ